VPELGPSHARIAELETKLEALTEALEKTLARIGELEARLARKELTLEGGAGRVESVAKAEIRFVRGYR
jgi:hypothetical protein